MTYNAMLEGFARQIDEQIGARLFRWNAFPGMARRPHLRIDPVNKLSLGELSAILAPLKNALPLGDEDYKAIRKQTGFLPETLPEAEAASEPDPQAEPQPTEETPGDETPIEQSLNRWRAWALIHDPETFSLLERRIE